MDDFEAEISTIRDRALLWMADGAITPTYGAQPATVTAFLNDLLATEVVCWLRYRQHAMVASGLGSAEIATEFAEHADREFLHALRVAERIGQLGGVPDLDPSSLADRSKTAYRTYAPTDLEGMLKENLLAERIVIQLYQLAIRSLGSADPGTRRVLEELLVDEEGHADDLRRLLGDAV
jgi:bacterioferritin